MGQQHVIPIGGSPSGSKENVGDTPHATYPGYLLHAPPYGQVWHKAFFRWVRAHGRSPHAPGISPKCQRPRRHSVSSKPEHYHPMQFSIIRRTPRFEGVLPLCRGYIKRILNPVEETRRIIGRSQIPK